VKQIDETRVVVSESAPSHIDRAWLVVGGIAIATFVVHVIAAARMHNPIIQADEAGYLSNARYLAQGIGRTKYGYESGYSLLLVPAALISHDPLRAYHLSLITNALLAASLPLLGFFLVRRVLPGTPTGAQVTAALLLVLYPGWSILTNVAMSENALVPAVLATACVIAVARQSWPRWCVAAVLASYTFWVSPRGLVIVGAFVFGCALSTRPWKRFFPGVPAIIVAVVGTVLGRVVNIAIAGTSKVQGVSHQNGLLHVFEPLIHPGQWNNAAATLLGWFSYACIATFGLAVVGAVVMTAALARRRVHGSSGALVPVAAFAVPALLGTLVLGALNDVQVSVAQLDYLVYGRYVDGVLAPVLVVGAAWLFAGTHAANRARDVTRALLFGAGVAVVVLIFAVIRPPARQSATLNIANILALRPFIVHLQHRSLPALLLAGVVVMTVGLVLTALDRRVGAAAMMLFLAWSSWVTYNGYAVHDSAQRAQQRALVTAIHKLREKGVDTSCIVIDTKAPLSGWHLANYRFFVPTSTFALAGETPQRCGPLVLSAAADVDSRYPGARPVAYENHAPIGLWIQHPSTALDGLFGPVPITAPLPASAYRSNVSVRPGDTKHHDAQLHITVQHTGSGAPWPGSLSSVAPHSQGSVRVDITVTGPSGTVIASSSCPLPHTLFPGDRVNLDCHVPLPNAAPGNYTAHVSLEQVGVTTFPAQGDGTATAPVSVG
jgi:hypothetical protein